MSNRTDRIYVKPRPAICPNCGGEAPCIDWVEVDIGIGVQVFDETYECSYCGAFALPVRVGRRDVVWRDALPLPGDIVRAKRLADLDAKMAEATRAD